MRITKYVHACVRVADGDRAFVIDPGVWVEPEAYEGIDEILITHEHIDHVDVEALVARAKASSALLVRAPAPVAEQLAAVGVPVETVSAGDRIAVAGFDVSVVGGEHAEIYDGLPGCANVGFVVDGRVYHPGDALFVPDSDVELLMVPVSAPWLKLAEAIDFVRAVGPTRVIPVHDALLSDKGAALTDRWLDMKGGSDYRRLNPRDDIEV